MVAVKPPKVSIETKTALEQDFPIVEISQLAEQESWRKEINRPIYHIHKWWATRLGSVFRGITLAALSDQKIDTWTDFYKYHQLTDKIVLDPFMGSGTTLGEAVKLQAKAIGCDINPISTFLVKQAFTKVTEDQLRVAFAHLEQQIAPEIRRYYQTRDPQTGELITVLYFFWVKTVVTPSQEVIPLFSRYVFSQDAYPKKKPQAQILCPKCWDVIVDRYDRINLQCPHCSHCFNPQTGPAAGQYVVDRQGDRHRIKDLLPDAAPPVHRLYAIMAVRSNGEKVYLPARAADLALYQEAEIRLQTEDLLLPMMTIRPGHNTNQARSYHYTHWRDFFNARQLLCLGLLLRSILAIDDLMVQEQMLCLFSSVLEFNNLFCSFKGEGTGAVRPLFSHHILRPERTPLENSIWGTAKSSGTFCKLFESRLLKAKRYLDEPFELDFKYNLVGERIGAVKTIASLPINVQQVKTWQQLQKTANSLMVLNGDSSDLPLPAGSIDAVITDPPYFDFIHYSELSDFFFAWLSPVLKARYPWFDQPDSFHSGEVQHGDPRLFAQKLTLVFAECCRVLKDDGILAFSFHHSRAEGWAAIHEAIALAGLQVVAAYPVHAELRAANPKNAAKEPISLDAILVCKKFSLFETTVEATLSEQQVFEMSDRLIQRLEAASMSLSLSDRFVILASQMMILLSGKTWDFDAVCDVLEQANVHYRLRLSLPS